MQAERVVLGALGVACDRGLHRVVDMRVHRDRRVIGHPLDRRPHSRQQPRAELLELLDEHHEEQRRGHHSPADVEPATFHQ